MTQDNTKMTVTPDVPVRTPTFDRIFITTHGVEVPLGDYPTDIACLMELEIQWQIDTCITEHITQVRKQAVHTTRPENIASALRSRSTCW